MASAVARAYMGVWGFALSGVQGQSPWLGGHGSEAHETDDILALWEYI